MRNLLLFFGMLLAVAAVSGVVVARVGDDDPERGDEIAPAADCQQRWAVDYTHPAEVARAGKGSPLYLGQTVAEVEQLHGKMHGQKWFPGKPHGSYWRAASRGGTQWWTLSTTKASGRAGDTRTRTTEILVRGQGDAALVAAINAGAPIPLGASDELDWRPFLRALEEQWGAPRLRHVPLTDTRYYELFGFRAQPRKWRATEWEDPACNIAVTAYARTDWTIHGRDVIARIAVFPLGDRERSE